MERPVLFGGVRAQSPRLSAAAAVALLHVSLVMGLMVTKLAGDAVPIPTALHETELVLPLPQVARPSAAPTKGAEQRGTATVPSDLKIPFTAPSPQAGAIGETLFGCNPENLRDLTHEQLAKCTKLSGNTYAAISSGLPVYIKPKGPEWEGLRNSDLRARERNTADPCLAAKMTGTDCIHEVIYGKGLW